MRILSEETERLCRKARLSDISGIPVYLPEKPWMKTLRNRVKRVLDLVLAVFAVTLTLPFCTALAIAIKIESSGPVLFKQRRSLRAGGPSFDLFKFRSMRNGADIERDCLHTCEPSDPVLFKMKDDPRVTKIGRLMRRFSVDELPQLINVIRGEMSLVGPRPLPVRDYEIVTPKDHLDGYLKKRCEVMPGMTGLWQVSGRSQLGFREMILLDLYYVENQSLLLDVKLLVRTIPAVLIGKGAY